MTPTRRYSLAMFVIASLLTGGCSKKEPPAPPAEEPAAATEAAPADEPSAQAAAAPAPTLPEPAAGAPATETSEEMPAETRPAASATTPGEFTPEPWRSLENEVQIHSATDNASGVSGDESATPVTAPPAVSAASIPDDAEMSDTGSESSPTPAAPTPEAQPEETTLAANAKGPEAAAPPPSAESGAAATTAKVDGAQVAQAACIPCHQAGINGAPKFANKVAWASRIAQGPEKLYENSIKGFRGMPPKGGNPGLTDEQVKAAVDYMVKAAGGYKE
ncbi:MAG: c-type cytochrome [Chromatiales bacterium]